MSRGYLNKIEKTAKKFLSSLFSILTFQALACQFNKAMYFLGGRTNHVYIALDDLDLAILGCLAGFAEAVQGRFFIKFRGIHAKDCGWWLAQEGYTGATQTLAHEFLITPGRNGNLAQVINRT